MTLKGRLAALTALAALVEGGMNYHEPTVKVHPDTEDQKATRKKMHDEVQIGKGLKWFDIDGIYVLALNRKNAIRKAKKAKFGN